MRKRLRKVSTDGVFPNVSTPELGVNSGIKKGLNHLFVPTGPSGHGHSTSHSGYLGCLGLSDSELKSSWKLAGRAPKCQYTHHAGTGNSTSSGSYENSGNTNNGGSDYGSSNSDSDTAVSNGDFGNVNDTTESEGDGTSDGGSGNNNGNGSNNANNNGNGGNNANNNGNGGNNANNNGNGGNNANNNDNGGNHANNNGNQGNANNNSNGVNGNNNGKGNNANDNGQDGKNSGNNGGQNQGQATFDPYGDFDITKCDTYENLWMWDLSLTCAKDGASSTCECIFAEEMMELGSISCDDAVACPRNCNICSRCMKLLGCQVPKSSASFLSSTRSFLMLATAVGFLIFGGAYYTRRRRRRGPSILQKVLLEDNNSVSDESTAGGRVWLAPVPSSHDSEGSSFYSYNNAAQLPIWVPPTKNGMDQKPMWLAPDASSRELDSSIDTTEKGGTSVWLAPDATSVQLKGSFEECEKHISEVSAPIGLAPNAPLELVQGESKSDHTDSDRSQHLTQEYSGLKLDTRHNDDPVRSALDTVSTARARQPKVRCNVHEDSKDKSSLGAWSYEDGDPSITGSSRLQSTASVTPLRAPEVNDDASSRKVAPETVSEESDDDGLPTLT